MTAPSMLFIIIRWIMLATAALQISPTTEATFDSILLPHMSDTDIFPSDCEALNWAAEVLYLAGFIETACKQAHFTATFLLFVLNSR